MNHYIELTREFNDGRTRTIISSGQAVVLHRLAMMSKDGDWIIREDEESCSAVLTSLAAKSSFYRFGAPLDCKWLSGGWSSHLEYVTSNKRIRCDFFSRPPRLSAEDLKDIWERSESMDIPFLDVIPLVKVKQTMRLKDYAVIGELARLLSDDQSRLLYSQSSSEIISILERNPSLLGSLSSFRPLLSFASYGQNKLNEELDRERRELMHQDELRLNKYSVASAEWASMWPKLQAELKVLPLLEAHAMIVEKATGVLPHLID